MTLEEAIKTAIEYETEARDVYRAAMKSSQDPILKRIFFILTPFIFCFAISTPILIS